MKLTSTLTRIDYVVIDFFCGVCQQKYNCFSLKKTSVMSSYITSLSTEYLYKF